MRKVGRQTATAYLFLEDGDTDLLNYFNELVLLDTSVVVEVEVLERAHKHGFLALVGSRFLAQSEPQFFLETKWVVAEKVEEENL